MTLLAGVREHVLDMIGIIRLLVIRLVARPAIRGSAFVLSIRVALRTACVDVRSREREVRQIVVKRGRLPGDRRMACRARMRHLQRFMIRVI